METTEDLAAHLDRIVRNVISSVLELEATPADGTAAPWERERTLTSCVQLTGAWAGAVIFHCNAAFARDAAGAVLGEASAANAQDVLGELANIAAGNIKPLLPGPTELSLPAVAEGVDYRLTVPGSHQLVKLRYACSGQPLQVILVERDAARGRRA